MISKARTVSEYLTDLPADRRAAIEVVRAVILKNLDKGYEEGMLWGMIAWTIPLERFPDTYNKQPLAYVALAAQKNSYSLYLMGVYADKQQEATLNAAYEALGKKPDMGKSCVRFKAVEDLPLGAIASLVAGIGIDDYIAMQEKIRPKKK